MTTISTQIVIEAPPERVWSILVDFAAYPDWNPFIIGLEGEPRTGKKLKVTLRPPGDKPMTFTPKVLRADAPAAFVWRGSLPVPGLFTGEHSFVLTREGEHTRFEHSEKFSGLLILFMKGLLARTEDGFNQMNAALKARAEART